MIAGQAQRLMDIFSSMPAPGGGAPVAAFVSGKGGTGKSFLALNLAAELASSGKRILLADTDSNTSSLGIMANVSPEKTLFDFYRHQEKLQDIIMPLAENLDFLPGDASRLDHPAVGRTQVEYLFTSLRKIEGSYDLVLLDTSSGLKEDLVAIMTYSDLLFVVANPEPTAVMDAYVVLKTLRHKEMRAEPGIIVNKCKTPAEGKTAYENLMKATRHFLDETAPLIGLMPYSGAVRESIMRQELLQETRDETVLKSYLTKLAKEIANIPHVANSDQPSKSQNSTRTA